MSLSYLKIKIKSLAAEASIIRHEERKVLKSGRWHRRRDVEDQLNTASSEQESAYSTYRGLHQHRTVEVRHEARAALIAYGYIRGKTFTSIEQTIKHEAPQWHRVVELIQKYSPRLDDGHRISKEDTKRVLARWLAEANLPEPLPPFFSKF